MRKVLIVDDEEDLCTLMRSYLSTLGYEVNIASTLTNGLDLMKRLKPDIIFLDNNLPDGTGWDQIESIHALLPNCKINLMSAYRNKPGEVQEVENLKYLEKPISLSKLKEFL
ncbi:MAG: response regulator [Bacteroidia bacterium]|nr:response regulator [Bacteroidia bacterium]